MEKVLVGRLSQSPSWSVLMLSLDIFLSPKSVFAARLANKSRGED